MINEEEFDNLKKNVDSLVSKNSELIFEKNRQAKRISKLEGKFDSGELEVKKITVGAPDSQYQVIISADKNIAGIWINGKQEDGIVAIYNSDLNGAVVGVWGYPQNTALDIALSAKNGPVIQVFDRNKGDVFFIDTTQINSLLQKKNNNVK